MRAHVRKWGNSLALRLPRTLAADANLEDGSPVELTLDRGRLVAAPVRETRVALRAPRHHRAGARHTRRAARLRAGVRRRSGSRFATIR